MSVDDPYDFEDVLAQWGRADSFHEERLRRLRTERFDPDIIGAVPVQPDRKSAERVPLRDVALVVHKGGRTVELRLHQAEHKKAVKSAVQAHPDFNQQPQDDPDDEYVLYLRVEPERAADRERRVRDAGNEWREQIRQVSHKRSKLHKQWLAGRAILPDDQRLLDKELQKRQDKKMAEVEAKEKQALQHINARS